MQTQIPAQQAQQNQSRTEHKSQESTQPQFEDARPEVTAQLRLQSLMANSARAAQLKSTRAMMAASTPARNLGQSPGAANPIPMQLMEDEEPLQATADEPVQREQAEAPNAENPDAEPPSESTPPQKTNNTGLPDNLKTGIENLSGISLDHVKVHYNSDKPAQLQAHAYAQGSEIHVAPGQEKHLPHEAWHVVQQAQGRVRPTVQMKGEVGVNDDEGLETEADVMGGQAMQIVVERQDERPRPTLSERQNKKPNPTSHDGKRIGMAVQRRMQGIIQLKWTEEHENRAQEKLGKFHNKVIEVPAQDVLNQQAWAPIDFAQMSVRVGPGMKFLQAIGAKKVIDRTKEFLNGKELAPPPVAFSTESALNGTGELILLDSHHTLNAFRMLTGASSLRVKHKANAQDNDNKEIPKIVEERTKITTNKAKAATYNATPEGLNAFKQALDEIMKLKQEKRLAEDGHQEKRLAEDSHKARSYDFQNASDLRK